MSYLHIPNPKNLLKNSCLQYPYVHLGKSQDTLQSGLFHGDLLPKLPKGPSSTRDSKPILNKGWDQVSAWYDTSWAWLSEKADFPCRNWPEDWFSYFSCQVFLCFPKRALHILLDHSINFQHVDSTHILHLLIKTLPTVTIVMEGKSS